MSKPTIAEIKDVIGRAGIWPVTDTVFETIQLDEDADGNGGLTIGWNSDEFHVIPAGTKVGEYILMEPYFPQDNGGGKFRYEPKFSDPAALLDKTPFIFNTKDTEGDDLALFTFPFTGLAGTIIQKLEDSINELIGGWTCNVGTGINASISVNFDGDTLKSAASKIAQACGCTLHYTWKQINFGTRQVYGGTEFYNRFIVFGGTTNMSRRIASGQYTSVVKRLTLDETEYPGSIIDKSAAGGTPMTKLLVFDDIYPKMELFIADVHERRCYLIDENGEKIPDGGYETDGSGSYILDEDGEKIPTYKQYSKWYVNLRYADGTQFTLNDDIILVGQTLKLLFQPNYDIFSGETPQADETSPLAAREFEVAYFDTATHEYEADDVDINGWNVPEGWFRIIFTAEGETIIPTTSELQLTPRIGNKVTLINVALSGQYTDIAKQQLLAAANAAIGDYDKVGLGGKAVAYPSDGEWPAQVSGVKAPLPDVGDLYQGLFVSSKSTDLITGREEITYGTFGERSLINSMIDKIDNAQTNGGGGTTKGNNFESGQNTQNSQNWRMLQLAGGNLGVKTVVQHVTNITDGLVRDVEAVQEQVDQKVDMWFRVGVPYPNEYSPNHAANAPVSEWPAEDYEAHAEDLYYDTNRIPDSYQSSLVWRWEYDETLAKWLWKNVTDAHTIDALEKIVDVASDGIISAGSEKSRLLIEWKEAVAKYNELSSSASNLGQKYTAYQNAFQAVGTMLNGGSTFSDVTVTPLWLNSSNFDTNTKLSDYNITPANYRSAWNAYYTALEDLTGEIKAKKCSIYVVRTDAYPPNPVPPYNVGDMWIIPNEDNKVMSCVYGRGANESYDASDWQDLSASEDVRTMLAIMVEQCYSLNKDYLGAITGGWTMFNIYLCGNTLPVLSEVPEGSIRFQPSASNTKICVKHDSVFKTITSGDSLYDSLYAALERVYNAFLKDDTMVTFAVYSGKNALPNNLPDNCLIARELSYTDPVTNTPLKGGIDILWYNGDLWQLISKATSAAIENLGNAIRLLVFGNEDYGSGQTVTIASGSAFGKALGMLFSDALDESGNLITGARIATYIKQGSGSNEKHILSGVWISADNVDFEAQNFSVDASKVTFTSGGTKYNMLDNIVTLLTSKSPNLEKALGMVIRQNGSNGEFSFGSYVNNVFKAGLQFKDFTEGGETKTKLLLTADNVDIAAALFTLIAKNITLAAERINFKTGNFSITDGNDNVTFTVDANGNVSLAGTITAKAGYIGGASGWVIETNKMSKGPIGTDESMHLATQDMTATINSVIYNTLRLTIGSKFGVLKDGKLIASNADISGKITIPADSGSFTYQSANMFGLYMDSSASFNTRFDYLSNGTTRGAILRIEQITASSQFRGIFCNGESEFQGVTQLLRTASNKDNPDKDALIVEGVDNKGNSKVAGKTIITSYYITDAASYTLSESTSILVCTRNGDQNITVPSSGVNGQIIRIKKNNSGWCFIKDRSGNLINQIALDRGCAFIIYDGTEWI